MRGDIDRRPVCHVHAADGLVRLLSLVITLALALLSAGAKAQSCGPAPGGEPNSCSVNSVASLNAQTGTNLGVGNPINVVTGNKYQREDDQSLLTDPA